MTPEEIREKQRRLDTYDPQWRERKHQNGRPLYSKDGTLLDDGGKRSIFDDVDE